MLIIPKLIPSAVFVVVMLSFSQLSHYIKYVRDYYCMTNLCFCQRLTAHHMNWNERMNCDLPNVLHESDNGPMKSDDELLMTFKCIKYNRIVSVFRLNSLISMGFSASIIVVYQLKDNSLPFSTQITEWCTNTHAVLEIEMIPLIFLMIQMKRLFSFISLFQIHSTKFFLFCHKFCSVLWKSNGGICTYLWLMMLNVKILIIKRNLGTNKMSENQKHTSFSQIFIYLNLINLNFNA